MGNDIYGLHEAAKAYFGEDLAQISLHDFVILLAIIKNPIKYDPSTNQKALKRIQ